MLNTYWKNKMEHLVEIFVPLSFFVMAFGIVYIVVTARNKERMAMIEKGLNLNESKVKIPTSVMKFALPIIGLALGLLFGQILYSVAYPIIPQELAIIASSLLFSGIGIVIYYIKFFNRDIEIFKGLMDKMNENKHHNAESE